MYAGYKGELEVDKLIRHLREKLSAEQWGKCKEIIRENHYLFSGAIIGHKKSKKTSLELLQAAIK